MNRFRPNIVVKGLGVFQEHQIAALQHENFGVLLHFPCERCVIIMINQEAAERHPSGEPFKTIKAINPSSNNPAKPAFGHYATLARGQGESIRVGDVLRANSD